MVCLAEKNKCVLSPSFRVLQFLQIDMVEPFEVRAMYSTEVANIVGETIIRAIF